MDFRKRQTSTATLAEPGGLPLTLVDSSAELKSSRGLIMKEWLVVRRRPPVRSGALEGAEPIARTSEIRPPSDDSPKVSIEQADSPTALPNREEIVTAGSPMPMSLIEPIACEPAAIQEIILKAKATGVTWGLRILGVDPTRFRGTGVSVAIIDTGIERSYPAFSHMPDAERRFRSRCGRRRCRWSRHALRGYDLWRRRHRNSHRGGAENQEASGRQGDRWRPRFARSA
jgi:hypothetical protein